MKNFTDNEKTPSGEPTFSRRDALKAAGTFVGALAAGCCPNEQAASEKPREGVNLLVGQITTEQAKRMDAIRKDIEEHHGKGKYSIVNTPDGGYYMENATGKRLDMDNLPEAPYEEKRHLRR